MWSGQPDIFGDRILKLKEDAPAVAWRGRGAWPGRQPRRASVGMQNTFCFTEKTTGRSEDNYSEFDDFSSDARTTLSPAMPKRRLPPVPGTNSAQDSKSDFDESNIVKLKIFSHSDAEATEALSQEASGPLNALPPMSSSPNLPTAVTALPSVLLTSFAKTVSWKSQEVCLLL